MSNQKFLSTVKYEVACEILAKQAGLVNVPPPIEAGASCFSENSTTNSEELWRLTLSPQA